MDTATLLGSATFAAFQASERARLEVEISTLDELADKAARAGSAMASVSLVEAAGRRRDDLARMTVLTAPPTPTAPTTPQEAA